MNINRYLRSRGFIFPKNSDPKNLKMLLDMGAFPIVKYTSHLHNGEIEYACRHYPLHCEACSIDDIKFILDSIELYMDVPKRLKGISAENLDTTYLILIIELISKTVRNL